MLNHPLQIKEQVIYLTHLTTKKEAQYLVGQFGILMQYSLHLNIAPTHILGDEKDHQI